MSWTFTRRLMPAAGWRRVVVVAVAGVGLAVGVGVGVGGCARGTRLVEVFDNGPAGGPPGGSMGYRWVGVDEKPTAGNGWKTVDYNTLTPEQRKRIW